MNENIKHKINNTLQSIDGLTPAEPKPFLLTRVHARLTENTSQNSAWSRIAAFIKRPVVAVCSVLLVIAVNIAAFNETGYLTTKSAAKRVTTSAPTRYDFAINVSGIYDIENQEP